MNATLEREPRPALWKVWWLAIRPKTLTAAFGPVLVGAAIAARSGSFRPLAAVLALLGAILLQVGTNLHNDVADFRSGADNDGRLGPARATQKGWLSPRQTAWGAALSFALALAVGGGLSLIAGWPVLVIGLVSVLSGWAYTGGPFPLGYHGLGDLFVFIFFGIVAVTGTAWVCSGDLPASAFWAAVPVGLWATAILAVNNLRDRSTDEESGKRTLVVRFGQGFARGEIAACYGLAYGLLPVAWLCGAGHPGWLLPGLSLPLAWLELRAIARCDGADLNPHLGRTALLGLVFCALLAGGIFLW